MDLWLILFLPERLWYLIGPFSLIAVGHIVEKHFVGRITMFTNAVALNVFIISIMNVIPLPNLLILYANIGLVLGIIGLFTYERAQSMPALYYTVTMMYNSAIIGLIMLFMLINS